MCRREYYFLTHKHLIFYRNDHVSAAQCVCHSVPEVDGGAEVGMTVITLLCPVFAPVLLDKVTAAGILLQNNWTLVP